MDSPLSIIQIVLIAINFLLLFGISLAVSWILFEKAGRSGWISLIPVYNTIVVLKIAGKPWWWIFLFLIPVVNMILSILVVLGFCRAYGKGASFGVGMLLLPMVFGPILAFSDAKYNGEREPVVP